MIVAQLRGIVFKKVDFGAYLRGYEPRNIRKGAAVLEEVSEHFGFSTSDDYLAALNELGAKILDLVSGKPEQRFSNGSRNEDGEQ